MIYLLNFIACLLLVIFQTAFLSGFHFTETIFDLGICYVISLCLFYRSRVTIPFALFLGFLMDSLSGGAFGLYMSVYFWMAISIRWAMNFFKIDSILIIPIVVSIGILFQNGLFLGTLFLFKIDTQIPISAIKTGGMQILLGFFIGPIVVHLMNMFHHRLNLVSSNLSTPTSRSL